MRLVSGAPLAIFKAMFSGLRMALLWDMNWTQSEVIVPNVHPRVIKPKVICFHYFSYEALAQKTP